MKTLDTWAKRSEFSYTGSIKKGTTIYFGKNSSITINPDKYSKLFKHFQGRTVNIGTSRTDPPRGSVGDWFKSNVTKTAIASYVGPILITEGYAEKIRGPEIKFKNKF